MKESPSPSPNQPGGATVKAEALDCPQCGAPIPVRSMGHAVTIVCSHCNIILDARNPKLTILQSFEAATGGESILIPLGSRGKWRGAVYEVIGFQRRQMEVEGSQYCWHEYLLFNPYKGFRYLTEYNGHWNDAKAVSALPEERGTRIKYLGKTYKHYQSCMAKTVFVIGEFPWQVSVGYDVVVTDYVAPPFVLSSETADNETTWTLGEYVPGEDIWKAFTLRGKPPKPVGVFANQPSKSGVAASQIWYSFLGLAAALSVILMANEYFAQQRQVFQDSYHFVPSPSTTDTSFVTPEFELKGHTSSLEVVTHADVSNQWIYLNYALINSDTGEAFDFGREISYYFGVDSDGRWTEGSQHNSVTLPSIPPGHYYLRIEPESDPTFAAIDYSVLLVHDVPVLQLYLAAFAALLLPALLVSWRVHNFEQLRWAESDHPKKM